MGYDYTKYHNKLIAVDLIRWKDADSTAIQQIEFVKQFKNTDGKNADGTESMLNEFGKNQRKQIKISSRKYNSLIKDEKLWRSKS